MTSVGIAPASRPTDFVFYTNRCSKCGRALTKLEILERMSGPTHICPCGSDKFHSSNFKWWEELFLIRSWKMFLAIRRGELAPPPTRAESESLQAIGAKQVIDKMIDLEEQEERDADEEMPND